MKILIKKLVTTFKTVSIPIKNRISTPKSTFNSFQKVRKYFLIPPSFTHRIKKYLKRPYSFTKINRLSIRMKLLCSFIAVALCTATIGTIGYYGLSKINASQNQIATVNLPKIVSLMEIEKSQLTIMNCERALYNENMTNPDLRITQYKKINTALKSMNHNISVFLSHSLNHEEQQTWNEYQSLMREWKKEHKKFIDFSKQKDLYIDLGHSLEDNSVKQFNRLLFDQSLISSELYTKSETSINELIHINKEQGTAAILSGDCLAKSITNLFIVISIFALLTAAVLGVSLSLNFEKILKALIHASKKLEKGETDIDIQFKSNDELGDLANAFERMVKSIEEQTDAAQQIASGNFDVQITKRSEKDILNISMIEMIQHIKVTYDEIENIVYNIEIGNFNYRDTRLNFEGGWKDIVSGINRILDVFEEHLNQIPIVIMTKDKDFNVQYLNQAGADLVGIQVDEAYGKKCYELFKGEHCQTENCACSNAMSKDEIAYAETNLHVGNEPTSVNYAGIPIKNNQGDISGAFEIMIDQTAIKKAEALSRKQSLYQKEEVEKLIVALEKLSYGNLDIVISEEKADKDTEEIAANFRKIHRSLMSSTSTIKDYIDDIAHTLKALANKNLTVEITKNYLGNFSSLKESINYITYQFNTILSEINAASELVEGEADQVASSSQSLSQGASQQANTVKEIAEEIISISKQTQDNSDSANKANELSVIAKKDAEVGKDQMHTMLSAMNEIKLSSQNISKIIKVIDEIAFQTNILALNAAVEAAHAQEHGKGFSVVAQEVRNLAQKSADAAKETTQLIDNSIQKVNEGYAIAKDTSNSLDKIAEGVSDVSTLVANIANDSNRQTEAIDEINKGIHQISTVTQVNTSTAQKSASTSQEMAAQSQVLKGLIQEFKLFEQSNTEEIEKAG